MKFIPIFFLSLVLVTSAGIYSCQRPTDKQTAEKKQPNIVFILADDMGYGDLGCYNADSKIQTPNIDKLSENGIRFTNVHAPGAWCVPSRYGLLTGTYPGRLENLVLDKSLIKPEQETIATLLKRNGYSTACVGKWHLGFDEVDWKNPATISAMKGGPTQHGFDYFFGMHASLDIQPYFYIENEKAVQSPTEFIEAGFSPEATSEVSGGFYRNGAISPDFKHDEVLDKFVEKAFGFMDKHQQDNAEEPFFLYLPLTAPHTPWLPKEEFVGKSGAGEYGDFMMQVDNLVGQVSEYLKENNLLENTIVIFSSDNGPVWFDEDVEKYNHLSTGIFKGRKMDMWEGGSRMPFIVSAPSKFKSGIKTDQMIGFTDVMATLAELVGDEAFDNADFDSYSFLSALTDVKSETKLRNELVIEKNAYFKGDWKYIKGSGMGQLLIKYGPNKESIVIKDIPGELYNLENDLSEQNNLYNQHPEKVKEMEARLNEILGNTKTDKNDYLKYE